MCHAEGGLFIGKETFCNLGSRWRLSLGHGGLMDRRRFLQTAAATTLMTSLSKKLAHAAHSGSIPMRDLGRTGEKVSMVSPGGHHIGMQWNEQQSIHIIRSAIDHGISFRNTCWN